MDVSYILNNFDEYQKMMMDRFRSTEILESIRNIHLEYTSCLYNCDQLRKLKNLIGSSINKTGNNNKLECENDIKEEILYDIAKQKENIKQYSKYDLILLGKVLKPILDNKENEVNKLFEKRNELVSQVPNLLYNKVFISNNEDNNPVIFTKFNDNLNNKYEFDQYTLCTKLDILEDASSISGNRGYFLSGMGVRLNYALLNYALEFISKKNYKTMYTPHFMNKKSMASVCQLSEFEETLYELKDENKFLIATSEQPMTIYFEGKVIKSSELPIKFAGVSTCFRKEAGSHGKDTLGMFRVHQFEKVEQFCVTDNESSWEMMEEMIKTASEFYESLGLSYRIVNIVSGALNNSAAMKYDLEGFFPGSKKYRELVSCTNTTDYFSRKLKTKDSNGKFVHMLNSTLYANTRTICCILETYQTDNGIIIPTVLQPYMGCSFMEFKK